MYCDIAYLTGAGVIDAQVLADLADDANQPGDITAAVTIGNINGAATAATELIDSYLRKAYDASLPLATPPEILRRCCAELTVIELWQRRGQLSDSWQTRHDYWVLWLRDVASGKVALDITVAGNTTTTGDQPAKTNLASSDREFSRDTLRGRF